MGGGDKRNRNEKRAKQFVQLLLEPVTLGCAHENTGSNGIKIFLTNVFKNLFFSILCFGEDLLKSLLGSSVSCGLRRAVFWTLLFATFNLHQEDRK